MNIPRKVLEGTKVDFDRRLYIDAKSFHQFRRNRNRTSPRDFDINHSFLTHLTRNISNTKDRVLSHLKIQEMGWKYDA